MAAGSVEIVGHAQGIVKVVFELRPAVTRGRVKLRKLRSKIEGVRGSKVAAKRDSASAEELCEKAQAMAVEHDAATAKL